MARLFLVRHGAALAMNTLRYQGHSDVPLSPLGLKQAEYLHQRLLNEPLEAIYSSDLQRASETAQIIARGHKLVPVLRRELRERCFGGWEGLTYAEIRLDYPELIGALHGDPKDAAPPDGESLAQLERRVSIIFVDIEQWNGVVLIVSHSGPLRLLLCRLLGLPSGSYWQLRLDYASLSIVDIYPEGAILSLLNDTCHLRGTE
ncbi:MAG: histidine phosphatase family protein [Chloroflexi bacterium]|nr:histidine phosphatase family protein [Chloroflexota bacterium]